MCEEKKKILNRINELIDIKRINLLQRFPYIHKIEDGIIIRFFTNWSDCEFNKHVKYKMIVNDKNSNDLTIQHFIPRGTIFEMEKREYIRSIICTSGKIDITINNEVIHVDDFKKIDLDTDSFSGIALEDTYIITSNK